MTLVELKAKAVELGLTPDDVRQHGLLTKKTTWEAAIDAISCKFEVAEAVEDIAVTVNQVEIDGELVAASEIVNPETLPTLAQTDERFKHWEPWMVPGATFAGNTQNFTILYFDLLGKCRVKGTDGNCLTYHVDTLVDRPVISSPGDDFVQNELPPSNPIPPIQPDEIIEVEGWHRWDEKLKVWIQEDPNQALKDCYQPESDSLRDQLLKRMQPYVGNCITQQDFEQLQNEPLDEPTAAVYLGLLDGSEKVLAGAIT